MNVVPITNVGTNASGKMSYVALTQIQIDLVAEAIEVAVNEHARFLEDDMLRAMAQVFRAMGKQREAELIEPE